MLESIQAAPKKQNPLEGHLEVSIKTCKMRQKVSNSSKTTSDIANSYNVPEQTFILLQLEPQDDPAADSSDQVSVLMPAAQRKPQKFRTDVQWLSPGNEDVNFTKNVFKFTGCNPYEVIKIRVAAFRVGPSASDSHDLRSGERGGANAAQSTLNLIKERNGPNIYTEAENGPKREIDQAKLFAESEIVSTGLLKFDIFEASES